MRSSPVRILITGGGTGGHIYPGLAVAESVTRLAPETEIVFAGTARGLEARIIPAAGYPLLVLPASGFRGLGVVARLAFVLNLIGGVMKAGVALLRRRPQVVLGTGGYASVPALVAAIMLGIPCAMQEQNSIPGSTNRLLGKRMRKIYLGFDGARRFFPFARCRFTGNPVRAAVVASAQPAPAENPDTSVRHVLLFGGSRGARTLNRAVMGSAATWAGWGHCTFLVQTGPEDLAEVIAACAEADNITVTPYIEDMASELRRADLVVCRAGAMTLAEIQCAGKPALLVPYPHATDDHQTHNAAACVEAGAAGLLADAACSADELTRRVDEVLRDGPQLARMGMAARAMARPDAAADIAADLLALAGHPAGKPLDVDHDPGSEEGHVR